MLGNRSGVYQHSPLLVKKKTTQQLEYEYPNDERNTSKWSGSKEENISVEVQTIF